MIKLNGEDLPLDGTILLDYLTAHRYDFTRFAVERNEEIVPKALYAETVLANGDVVKIVNFVGGGAHGGCVTRGLMQSPDPEVLLDRLN